MNRRSNGGDEKNAFPQQGDKLVAHPETCENRIERLKKALEGKTLPKIMVDVPEEHVGRRTIDPAAETEFNLPAKEVDFAVFEKPSSGNKADVILVERMLVKLANSCTDEKK